MTRILVQRGSAGSSSSSSSNPGRTLSVPGSSSSSAPPQPQVTTTLQAASALKDEETGEEVQEQVVVDDFGENLCSGDCNTAKSDDIFPFHGEQDDDGDVDNVDVGNDGSVGSCDLARGVQIVGDEKDEFNGKSLQTVIGCSYPPPPPVPPPKPSSTHSISRRPVLGSSNSPRFGSSRRAAAWPVVSTTTSPTGSRSTSPRSHCESEGYNSADEQSPCFGSSYSDADRERQFEIDIRRTKGLEVKRMLEDGNCLFRAVADQVYGDSEAYNLIRQMCIDYMEQERDHFSQFITEGFTFYCKRKRRDKVYGNNVEIQALAEMYNRPIHIYSYSTEPINIFHRSYSTDTPPIRLSYHHGNHYNSLVDPRRLTIGAGLGFSSLHGRNADKGQVKDAIKAQQDQQIDNRDDFTRILSSQKRKLNAW